MQVYTTCELLGPPAAGKSRLAAELRLLGHSVVDEQLRARRKELGPRPQTVHEQLRRQQRAIEFVLSAVRREPRDPVVDVGVMSALIFGVARLPQELARELLDFALDRSRGVEVYLRGICFVDAPETVLRGRAAADQRARSSLAANLELTPTVAAVVGALRAADPGGVRTIRTDGDVDLPELSGWIRERSGTRSDYLSILAQVLPGVYAGQ